MRNHAHAIVACDFFVAVTACFRLVDVFVALEVGTRRIVHWNVTEHPSAAWTIQQLRMFVPAISHTASLSMIVIGSSQARAGRISCGVQRPHGGRRRCAPPFADLGSVDAGSDAAGESTESLLATQGVSLPIGAQFRQRLEAAHLWDGTPLPPGLQERLTRTWTQLHEVEGQIFVT